MIGRGRNSGYGKIGRGKAGVGICCQSKRRRAGWSHCCRCKSPRDSVRQSNHIKRYALGRARLNCRRDGESSGRSRHQRAATWRYTQGEVIDRIGADTAANQVGICLLNCIRVTVSAKYAACVTHTDIRNLAVDVGEPGKRWANGCVQPNLWVRYGLDHFVRSNRGIDIEGSTTGSAAGITA